MNKEMLYFPFLLFIYFLYLCFVSLFFNADLILFLSTDQQDFSVKHAGWKRHEMLCNDVKMEVSYKVMGTLKHKKGNRDYRSKTFLQMVGKKLNSERY